MLAEKYQNCEVLKKYERDGKNYALVREVCGRCGGSGYVPIPVNNGICFQCRGQGGWSTEVRDYTDREWASMQKRKATIAAKKEQARLENIPKRNIEIVKQFGFKTSKIYLIVGATYDMNPMLKDLGARWNPEVGWFFQEDIPGFITIPWALEDTFILDDNDEYLIPIPGLKEEVDARRHEMDIELGARRSEHVGTVGQKITVKVWLAYTTSYVNQWGQNNIHKFVDNDGNIYKWSTQKYLPTGMYTLTGTIKGHDVYNGEPQTVLTRCKVS